MKKVFVVMGSNKKAGGKLVYSIKASLSEEKANIFVKQLEDFCEDYYNAIKKWNKRDKSSPMQFDPNRNNWPDMWVQPFGEQEYWVKEVNMIED